MIIVDILDGFNIIKIYTLKTKGVCMKKLIVAIVLLGVGVDPLFAKNNDIDNNVLKTYLYMSNSKTFHFQGKILTFPKYAVHSNCVDISLLNSDTINRVNLLKKRISGNFGRGCSVNGSEGVHSAYKIGADGVGMYVFDRLEILD